MPAALPARRHSPASLLPMLAALAVAASCAAPAPPQPPAATVPDVVTDLQAHQAGMAVVLHFTLPDRSTDRERITGPRRVEIYREFALATPSATPPHSAPNSTEQEPPGPPAYTLDAQALATDLTGDGVVFEDRLAPEQFAAHENGVVSYRVRTAAGGEGWSELSSPASVALVVPPALARDLTATVSAAGVSLQWSPPAPAPSPEPESYAIYRTPLGPGAGAAGPAEAMGVATGSSYQDTTVEPGHSYRYTVRSLTSAPSGEVESADSLPIIVIVAPPAPPAPPQDVVALPVRRPEGSLEVDLSWAISGERDLAGYNVYRSERPGERGVRLNAQPLVSATFRDTTVAPGRSYQYSVTALGLAGKESEPSAPVTAAVPKTDPETR